MKELEQEEWREQLGKDANAAILDVRTEEEVEEGYIPNSKNIDIYKGQGFIDEIEQLDKDKTSFLLSFSKKEKSIVNIKDSLTDMILPLMNLDKNVFPENILIPQENIKKLKGELKKTFETETKPPKPLDER